MRPKGYCVEVEFIIITSKIGAFYIMMRYPAVAFLHSDPDPDVAICEISLSPAPKLITLPMAGNKQMQQSSHDEAYPGSKTYFKNPKATFVPSVSAVSMTTTLT